MQVLIADDNADAVDTLAAFIEMLGYEAKVVYDGAAAVEAATREQPEVVILDIGMPKLNGWEACKKIRAIQGKKVRIVALTGWGTDVDRKRSEEAGFDAHWVKPLDPGEIMNLLKDDRVH